MLVGALPERDLLALFQESAIYICTSRYEPFGLAPLEAALCGCAILANSIESLREVWHDGALYFGDAASLSRLLDKLRSNSDLLKTAQARSLRRAQRFTRGRMVEGYLAVYRSTLERVTPQPLRETAHVA
jgi:glycosyltransferase involved in cell wall biosynthesis